MALKRGRRRDVVAEMQRLQQQTEQRSRPQPQTEQRSRPQPQPNMVQAQAGQARAMPTMPAPQIPEHWRPLNQMRLAAGQPVSAFGGTRATQEQRYAYNRYRLDQRAAGESIDSFMQWRSRQKGAMGFNWGAVAPTAEGAMAARAQLDNIRLQEQIEAIEDTGGADYYNSLAGVYARAGKPEQAEAARTQAFALRKMTLEAGHKAEADKRAIAADTAKQTARLEHDRKELDFAREKFDREMVLAREKLENALKVAAVKAEAGTVKDRRDTQLAQLNKGADRLEKRAQLHWDRYHALQDEYRTQAAKDEVKRDDLHRIRLEMAQEKARLGAIFASREKLTEQIAGLVGEGGDTEPDGAEVTATNPDTGERLVWRNGKWEPLQ